MTQLPSLNDVVLPSRCRISAKTRRLKTNMKNTKTPWKILNASTRYHHSGGAATTDVMISMTHETPITINSLMFMANLKLFPISELLKFQFSVWPSQQARSIRSVEIVLKSQLVRCLHELGFVGDEFPLYRLWVVVVGTLHSMNFAFDATAVNWCENKQNGIGDYVHADRQQEE